MKEARFAMLARTNPQRAERLLRLAQRDIDERWHFYEQMAGVERTRPRPHGGGRLMSVDLRTKYLGLELENPLVVSACSLRAATRARSEAVEDAGAAAVVLPSLFEEQIDHDQMAVHEFYEFTSEKFAEALLVLPRAGGLQHRARDVPPPRRGRPSSRSRSRSSAASTAPRPAAGSRYARLIEDAGADALELNIYYLATDPRPDRRAVEARYLDLVAEVREAVTIPLAVKIGPVLQLDAEHGRSGWPRPGPTAWCCSTASPAGHRPGDAPGRAPAGAEHQRRAPAAAALDRHPLGRASSRRWPPPPASTRRRTCSSSCSPGPT